jgi:hypothetical protein
MGKGAVAGRAKGKEKEELSLLAQFLFLLYIVDDETTNTTKT